MKKKLLALLIALVTIVTSFAVISLAANNTDAIADQIVLSFGKDETERNLAWFSEKSTAGEVRLAEASKVVGGVFPTEYKTFSVTSKASSFESGKYSKKATITGLSENTRYAYVFAVGTEVSDIYYFDVGSFGDFDFVFIADPQLIKTSDADKWRNSLNKITNNLGADLIVCGGDQVNTADSVELYNAFIIDEMAGVTFAPSVGPGHEESPLYGEHYNVPNPSSKYGSNSTSSNYWYVYNNVLFMNLNSSDRDAFSNGEHAAFVKEAMAANPDVDWNIVVTHYSLFSTGIHGEEMVKYREPLAPKLTELGVDLVLTAHDHVYVRTHMMDGVEVSDDFVVGNTAYDPEGTLYVECNSVSGTKLYNQESFGKEWVAKDDYKHKCAIKFEVTETSLSMKSYYLDDMTVFDTFTIEKEAPANIDAELELEGVDVTLTDGVLLNFYISSDELLRGVDNAELVKKNGKDCYKITAEVAAKEMGDEVTVQLRSGETLIGSPFTLSVKEYAQGIIGGNFDADTKAMVKALLAYGAAAQNYFGYKTDSLVGTPVTDISKLKGVTVEGASVTDADGIFVGASLVLEGTMKLRFYFNGNDLSVTVDGKAVKSENKEEFCYVDVSVFPVDIDKVFEVRCGSATVKYSVLNYLKNNADNSALSEMVASIYEYGTTAKSYAKSHCTHEGAEFKVAQLPTIFSKGIMSAYCERCKRELRELIDETEADVKAITDTGDTLVRSYEVLGDVVSDGNHFYPTEDDPDGKSLFIEFSMLLNKSMDNFAGTNITFPGIYQHVELPSNQGHSAHWFYFKKSGNQAQGSFELSNSNCKDYLGSVTCQGSDQSNYVVIDNFYGWHRFGVEIHQNTHINGTTVTYDVTVSLYVDGVKVHEYLQYDKDGRFLLYTAEVVNGKVVYTELTQNYVGIYRFNAKVSGQTAYFVTADEYVSCGDDFIIKVRPVEELYKEDFEIEDGVSVDGTMHFELNFG